MDYARILGLSGQKFLWSMCLSVSFGQPHFNDTLVEYETSKRLEQGSLIVPPYSKHGLVTVWSHATYGNGIKREVFEFVVLWV